MATTPAVWVVAFLDDEVVAEVDTLVADVDARTGDQFPFHLLTLPTEGALQPVESRNPIGPHEGGQALIWDNPPP